MIPVIFGVGCDFLDLIDIFLIWLRNMKFDGKLSNLVDLTIWTSSGPGLDQVWTGGLDLDQGPNRNTDVRGFAKNQDSQVRSSLNCYPSHRQVTTAYRHSLIGS